MGITFHIYRFSGITEYTWNGKQRFNEMSLKDCLDKVFNTSFDDTTEKLFKRNGFNFICNEITLEELTEEIGKGLAVFPVSTLQKITEVKNYIEIGLDPVFMRATDFRTFKRLYGN